MTPASLLAQGRCCGLFALCALAPAVWADCTAPQPLLSTGLQHSRWQEFDSQGRPLVDESGLLQRTGLRLEGACQGLEWAAEWAHARGTRDYDGQSNTGQPLQTTSRVRSHQLQLQAWAPLDAHWALGAQLGWTQTDRDLASVGMVRGYPEQFRSLQAGLGGRYTLADAGGLRWSVAGWLGGGPGGTLHLQLPNADAARLRLGRSQWGQVALQLEQPAPGTGWSWRLAAHLRQEQMRAGPVQAITRNGLLVGGASQPKTRQTSLGLDGALRYRF